MNRRGFLSALVVMPALALTRARAANLQTDMDLVPTTVRTNEAINYSANEWTNIAWANVGGTCFTCHTHVLRGGPYKPLYDAAFRVCLGGTGQVRLASFYYDASGNAIYDRDWGPPLQCRPQYGVDNQGNDIAAHFNAMIGPSTQQQIFTVEVLGTGYLYMARLELDWST